MAVLFGSLVVLILMGVPIGFCLAISATIYLMTNGSVPLSIISQKIVEGCGSFTMMPLPLFILSGAVMVYGSTPRLMRMSNLLMRRVPGGIGAVGILGCGLFGTVSGSGIATTAAVGSIVAPEMVKQGYKKGYTASIIAASGTLGGIIPPSVCLVVYATTANVSIGKILIAAILPGIFALLVLGVFNAIMAKVYHVTGGGGDMASYDLKQKMLVILDGVPPLMMPIIILGGVMSGIVTPTESATVATVYAFILASIAYRELPIKEFFKVCAKSAVSSGTLLFILAASAPFGWVLTVQNVPTNVAGWLLGLNAPAIVIFGAILLILVFLGTFLETLSIIILVVPIMLPIVTSLGMDPLHFGIVIGISLCIGSITPPLASGLFTSCRILDLKVDETFPEILEVIAVFILIMVIIASVPQMSLFLPRVLG